MIDRAAAIGNPPVPGHQLDGLIARILDADMVRPEPATLCWRRLFVQEVRRNANGNTVGGGADGKKGFEDIAHKPATFNA